jgi:hypothetical protein
MLCADNWPHFSFYTFLRHTGFIWDELSAQGLVLWMDDEERWRWHRQGTDLKSTQGFWAIGETVVDALMSLNDASPGRFPETFSTVDKKWSGHGRLTVELSGQADCGPLERLVRRRQGVTSPRAPSSVGEVVLHEDCACPEPVSGFHVAQNPLR